MSTLPSGQVSATVIIQSDVVELGCIANVDKLNKQIGVRSEGLTNASLKDCDLLVVLGSDWSLAQNHISRRQMIELQLIEDCLSLEIPIFGICYGAQALTRVLGGEVQELLRPEIGWSEVSGVDDEEFTAGNWFQWHYDYFVPPHGARVLAFNEFGSQAYQIGSSLAVQFHPEIDRPVVDFWIQSGGKKELDASGISSDDLGVADTIRFESSRRRFAQLFENFLEHTFS